MAKKKEERIVSIDLLRILAIVLVVGFHVAYEISLDNSLRSIGFVGISLFFIISGFVLAKNYPLINKFNLRWYLKRYIKIASVYYITLVVIVILFSRQVYSGELWKNLVLHFLFLDNLSSSTSYGIISPAWFLTPLIGLYILFPYLNRFLSKKHIFSGLFLIFIFALMIYIRIKNGALTSYSPLFFIGEFCFGIFFAKREKSFFLLAPLIVFFIKPVMVLPFLIFYVFYFFNWKYLPSKILNFIGDNTLPIFLFHESFMKLIFGKWHIYNLDFFNSLLILIAVTILTCYISKKIQNYLCNLINYKRT